MSDVARRQLAALAELHEQFARAEIEYRLFGGWAVDFHAGSVTRSHDDVDLAVWLDDRERIVALLERDGWTHAPEPDEDGGTGYERDGVRVELTFLVRANGVVSIPLRAGPVAWPDAMDGETAELLGVTAKVVRLDVLRRTKSRPREDEGDAAKDRADFSALEPLLPQ